MVPLKERKVRREMTAGVITVGSYTPLPDVINTMAENDISSVVVIYPNGTGMGVISSMDIVKLFLKKPISEIKALIAEDIMTDVIEIDPEKTLEEASKIMIEKNIHRLVVLSSPQAGRRPVGILSATDIVKKLKGL